MNVMMLLEMATQVAGDRVAFGRADDGLTYQALFDRAGGAARGLQEAEAGTLASVGLATDAFPTAVFASSWAGIQSPKVAPIGVSSSATSPRCERTISRVMASPSHPGHSSNAPRYAKITVATACHAMWNAAISIVIQLAKKLGTTVRIRRRVGT